MHEGLVRNEHAGRRHPVRDQMSWMGDLSTWAAKLRVVKSNITSALATSLPTRCAQ